MRFGAGCPACKREIRWHHLLISPLAPVYFTCPHCQAKLRLATPGQLVRVWVYVFGLALAALLALRVVPIQLIWMRLGVTAAATVALAIFICLTFPLQADRIAPRSAPGSRPYFITLLVLFGVTVLVLAPLATRLGAGLALLEMERSPRLR